METLQEDIKSVVMGKHGSENREDTVLKKTLFDIFANKISIARNGEDN